LLHNKQLLLRCDGPRSIFLPNPLPAHVFAHLILLCVTDNIASLGAVRIPYYLHRKPLYTFAGFAAHDHEAHLFAGHDWYSSGH
jgi:hypothetical protein